MAGGAKRTTEKTGAKGRSKVTAGQKRFPRSINAPIDSILHLHKTMGNQAVQRLLRSGGIQAKLRIGPADDVYEREADRVADQVMRMPEPVMQPKPT